MNAPLKAVAALALALAAGAPVSATTTKRPVSDEFVGLMGPNECYASQCPGELSTAEAALDPKILERQQLADGSYAYLKQTADGSLLQLKDGSWAWTGSSTRSRPASLETLAQSPELPQSLHDAARQALQDKAAVPAKSAEARGPVNALGGASATAVASTPAAEPDPSNLAGLGEIITAGLAAGSGASAVASASRISPGDVAGTDGGAQSGLDAGQPPPASASAGGVIDPGSYGFVRTRKAAGSTLALLGSDLETNAKAGGDSAGAPKGSHLFSH